MNLTTIVEQVKSQLPWGSVSSSPLGKTSSLSDMIKAASAYANQIEVNMSAVDAVAGPLSSAECTSMALTEAIEAQAKDADVGVTSNISIDIDESDVEMIISGLQQANELQESVNETAAVTISDANGEVYYLETCALDSVDSAETLLRGKCADGYYDIITAKTDALGHRTFKMKPYLSSLRSITPSASLNSKDVKTRLTRVMKVLTPTSQIGNTILDLVEDLCSTLTVEYDIDLGILGNLNQVLSSLSLDIASTISDALSLIEGHFSIVIKSSYSTHITSLAKNLVDSASINDRIIATIDSIKQGRIATYVSSAASEVTDASKAVRRYYNNLRNAYSRAGIRGAILYVLGYAKTISTLTAEDGTFMYSDNNSLRPKEFIAGLVGSFIETVLSAVSMILAVFGKVILLVFTVLGSIAAGLWRSLSSTYDDTNARMNEEDVDTTLCSIHNTVPFSCCQATMNLDSNTYYWYAALYYAGSSVCSISVPGGEIYIGPGSYNTDEDGQPKVNELPSSVRWEFHPYSVIFNPDAVLPTIRPNCLLQASIVKQAAGDLANASHAINIKYLLNHAFTDSSSNHTGLEAIMEAWKHDSIYLLVPENCGSGVLSSDDDEKARAGVSFCMAYFSLYMAILSYEQEYFDAYDRYPSVPELLSSIFGAFSSKDMCGFRYHVNDSDRVDNGWERMLSNLYNYSHNSPAVFSATWNNLVDCAVASIVQSNVIHLNITPIAADYTSVLNWRTYDDPTILTLKVKTIQELSNDSFSRIMDTPVNSEELEVPFFNQPSGIDQLSYALILPQYSKTTYWIWVMASTAVIVATSVVVMMAAVKFAKFKKKVRTENAAKYRLKQQQYDDAMKGNVWETDENGKPIWDDEAKNWKQHHIDPNSEEAKAYQNSVYKSFKKLTLKNNIQAALVGGTRYDYSDYWGLGSADAGSDADEGRNSVFASAAELGQDSDAESQVAVTNFYEKISRALNI